MSTCEGQAIAVAEQAVNNRLQPRLPNGRFTTGAGRWSRGQSGNISGRPRGLSITAQIRAYLDADSGAKRKELVASICEAAIAGSHNHVREILARLDGPITATLGSTSDGTMRLVVEFVEQPAIDAEPTLSLPIGAAGATPDADGAGAALARNDAIDRYDEGATVGPTDEGCEVARE